MLGGLCRVGCSSRRWLGARARARGVPFSNWVVRLLPAHLCRLDVHGLQASSPRAEHGILAYDVDWTIFVNGSLSIHIFQIRAILAHVEVEGGVLDCCGAAGDAVSTVLTAHSIHVTTNDFDPRIPTNSHINASTDAPREAFNEDARRPKWIVTSPPYRNAWGILKQASLVARVGVAFKLRL